MARTTYARSRDYPPKPPVELRLLRRALALAQAARAGGNHPFGALLADELGVTLLEAGNTVVTGRDCTGHAELNLVRLASARLDRATPPRCTLYTSTEPCAIFWSGIGRVVFGLGEERLLELAAGGSAESFLRLPCREVFARGHRPVEVVGPLLEDEAAKVHEGFWQSKAETANHRSRATFTANKQSR